MKKGASKEALKKWILEALGDHDGSATIIQVAKHIWIQHEHDLRASGYLFYTWQYDMRWAALGLRKEGHLAPSRGRGRWKLSDHGL